MNPVHIAHVQPSRPDITVMTSFPPSQSATSLQTSGPSFPHQQKLQLISAAGSINDCNSFHIGQNNNNSGFHQYQIISPEPITSADSTISLRRDARGKKNFEDQSSLSTETSLKIVPSVTRKAKKHVC